MASNFWKKGGAFNFQIGFYRDFHENCNPGDSSFQTPSDRIFFHCIEKQNECTEFIYGVSHWLLKLKQCQAWSKSNFISFIK